jgi:hypothetical protein
MRFDSVHNTGRRKSAEDFPAPIGIVLILDKKGSPANGAPP